MLEKVKISNVRIREDLGELILPLLKRSKSWKIESIEVLGVLDLIWSNLAKVPTSSGHIGQILSLPDPKRGSQVHKEHLNTLRNLWDISEGILDCNCETFWEERFPTWIWRRSGSVFWTLWMFSSRAKMTHIRFWVTNTYPKWVLFDPQKAKRICQTNNKLTLFLLGQFH